MFVTTPIKPLEELNRIDIAFEIGRREAMEWVKVSVPLGMLIGGLIVLLT